jgi:rsbT antagonist protein RsbS
MALPVAKQGDHLIVSVHSALVDEEWIGAQEQLLSEVSASGARSVLLDLGSLDILDSFAARMLRSIGKAIQLRGAQCVVVGIGPDVAYAMVQLGLNLDGIAAALDLDDAIDLLRRGPQARWHAD